MPITDILEHNCAAFGEDVCLVEINPDQTETLRYNWKEAELVQPSGSAIYRREITWNVFNEKANRFANLLIKRGVKKGDKVAILMMNCLEWLPIYFGILKTGALAVPFNFRYTSDEIAYCLALADVDVMVFGTAFTERLAALGPELTRHRLMIYAGDGECPAFAESYRELTADCASTAPHVPLADSDDAAIYFSSGTTGFPKAILHNHESLMHACRTEQAHHGQTKDDIFLCIPPLYHTGAKMHWMGSFLVGGKAVLLKGTRPEWVLDAVSKERCTIVWLLVPWAQDILTAIESGAIDLADYELSQWRLMHIGAQPVPQSLVRRWISYFPGHAYDTNYGLSESIGPGCVHLGTENVHKVGSIGVPGFGWHAKIIDPSGAPVPQGTVGELCVQGPGLMTCYYKNPAATDEVLKDGWLLTGDMAMLDPDGFIYLVDRKKDVIISGGENLYPVQIEDFLSAFPPIQDVAVIGLPDPRLGEIAAAIIQLKPGASATEADVNAFCHALPRYKRPRKLIFADVPRNPTGKIEKPLLRERYGGANLVDVQNRA